MQGDIPCYMQEPYTNKAIPEMANFTESARETSPFVSFVVF